MCGIFGYIRGRNASELLVKGLLRLEYRGYDSSGVVVKNGQLQSYKDIGKISEMASSLVITTFFDLCNWSLPITLK